MASGLLSSPTWAATFFSNDLSEETSVLADFTENEGVNGTWSYSTTAVNGQDGTLNTVLTSGATLTASTDDDNARSYLATQFKDYANFSWTAHIAVETDNVDPKNWIFFGIGPGIPDTTYYNEPRTGDEGIFLNFQSGVSARKVKVTTNTGAVLEDTGLWRGDPGYDIWMHYDHVNETIQFELDDWNGGRFSDIDIITDAIPTAGWLEGSDNMSIYFGGNGTQTFGDFSVVETVPEPSSTALLGLGGLALILRRRK
ncbi:PEP-CTERM sorting domain-containing protein [Verrucomicrobiaceae bacterium R5-34]|nr:PEP-CTERM sorting domain-containing protein [Verrucomicrobiaceae bacterium R5-34]